MSCNLPKRARAAHLRPIRLARTLVFTATLCVVTVPAAASDGPNDLGSALRRQQENLGEVDIALSQRLMAGRDRYMLVVLDRDEVYFVDLTAQNEIANPGQVDCYRTR